MPALIWVLPSMYSQILILFEKKCHTGCIDIFPNMCPKLIDSSQCNVNYTHIGCIENTE